MKRSKKERLIRAGWSVAGPSEFLGLSPQEEKLVDLKLDLSRGLKARRARKNLTQSQLAKLLGSSQSRVAKMEAGDPSVSIDLFVRSLLAMGATRSDLARVFASKS